LVVSLLSDDMVGSLNPAKRLGFDGEAVEATARFGLDPNRLNGLLTAGESVFATGRRGRLPKKPASRDPAPVGVFAALAGGGGAALRFSARRAVGIPGWGILDIISLPCMKVEHCFLAILANTYVSSWLFLHRYLSTLPYFPLQAVSVSACRHCLHSTVPPPSVSLPPSDPPLSSPSMSLPLDGAEYSPNLLPTWSSGPSS
jgi:hypothetical protein